MAWLDFEESRRFLQAVSDNYPQWYNFIYLLVETGCRVSELQGLFWEEVDLKKGIINIRRKYSGGVWGPTKSSKSRVAYLTEGGVAALSDQKAKSFFGKTCVAEGRNLSAEEGHIVFPGPDGKPRRWAPNSLERAVTGACKLAGVKRIRVHDLRHSFASQLRLKSVPVEDIQEALGHADIRMALRYAKVAPETRGGR